MGVSRDVLWLSALLAFAVGAGLSCADETDFDHAYSDETSGYDATPLAPDPDEKGDYDGDPIIYKVSPEQADPGNKYVQYMRTPAVTWTMNELEKKTVNFTAGSTNSAPTISTDVAIVRQKQTMAVPEIRQVAAPQARVLGPVRQRGIVTKTSLGESQRVDEFISNNRGLVDILLVMDNSGSMHFESTYIMRYLPELMKHIWRSDWRLGVVTSGPSDVCNVTTASVKDAADDTKLDFALDRDSMNYRYFNKDLGYSPPRYLEPYYRNDDYKWLSPCGYNILGYCNSGCSSTNTQTCMNNSTYDYYDNRRNQNKHNPLWNHFSAAVTLPSQSSADNGNEQLLRKLRWTLEGKTTTGCQGDWVRDNATVIAIVVTDEGHSCDDTEYTYCSIDAYKDFVTTFRQSHPFKTYAVLGSTLQSDGSTRSPNWDSEQLKAFDGYVINYRDQYEGRNVGGYFKGLPNGFKNYTPPTRLTSSDTSYHEKLSKYYGHRALHLISMAIAEELRNVYSPLTYVPDTGSAMVKIGNYTYDKNTLQAEYIYSDISACRAGDTTNQGECFKVSYGGHGSALKLVNYSNMTHFDKKVKVTYNYGGTSVSAVPFDNSWTLNFAPDPSTVRVSVDLVDGTTNTLSASDYTLSGTTLSVDANRVEQLVPEGSSITINYESPTTLNTSFTLARQYQLPSGSDVVPNSVSVTIIGADGNDRGTLASGFNFNGSTISFNAGNAPAAGESFTMSYDYWSNIVTSYSYSRSGNTDSSVALSCMKKSNNLMVSCTYDAATQTITFSNSGQFNGSDIIEVTETLQRVGSGVTLSDFSMSSYDYFADGEIYITLGSDRCSTTDAAPNMLTVNNGVIELAGVSGNDCVIINSLNSNPNQSIAVHYMGYKKQPDDFLQMDKSFFAQHKGKYKFEYWEVTVGGQPKTDFMIEDYKITEIDGVMIDDKARIRSKFGNNEEVRVIVRLYHAL